MSTRKTGSTNTPSWLLAALLALCLSVTLLAAEEETIQDAAQRMMFELAEAEPNERDSIVRELWKLGSPYCAPTLLSLLAANNEDDLPITKTLALRYACRLVDEKSIPTLRDMLESEDAAVREYAVRVLPFTDTTEGVPLLKACARDKERRVKLNAITALGETADRGVLPFLEQLVRSKDSGEAAAAKVALTTLHYRLGTAEREDFGQRLWPARPIAEVGPHLSFWRLWCGGDRLHVRVSPRHFAAEKLDQGFIDYLKRCRLLLITGASGTKPLFTDEKLKQALTDFVKTGGTLFFSGGPTLEAKRYLVSIGVTPPARMESGEYSAIASVEDPHPLTSWPCPIPRESVGADSTISWGAWHESQMAPYRNSSSLSQAAMLVQENVLDAGRVILSGITGVWETGQRHCDMVENILATAFGAPDRALYYFYLLRDTFHLPHWQFAKPWGGKKLKVLFIGDRYVKRDIVELCDRADFDYEFAILVERREGSYARNSSVLEGTSIVDVQQKLAGDYDVYVVARRKRDAGRKHWELLPEDIRRVLMRKVSAGKGLVVIGQGQGAKECKPDAEIAEIRALPVLEDDLAFAVGTQPFMLDATERQKRVRETALKLHRLGEGRIALLNNFGKPGAEFGCPGLADPFTRFRHHDYAYSLYLRTLLWAAKKQPDVRFVSVEPERPGLQALASPLVTLRVKNAGARSLTIKAVADVIDKFESVEGKAEAAGTIEAGKEMELRLSFPALNGGVHVARITIRNEQDQILNWASVPFMVASPVRIAGAEFDRPAYWPGQTVRATVKLDGDVPDAKLVARLIDTRGRLLAQEEKDVPAGQKTVELSFPIVDPVALLADLDVRLLTARGPLCREQFPVSIRCERRDMQNFKWYVWRNAGNEEERLATAELGVDYAHITTPSQAENSLRYNGGVFGCAFDIVKPPGPPREALPARRPCFMNTGYAQRALAKVESMVPSYVLKCGVRDIMLADESTIGGQFCFCPSCKFYFRRWLQRIYGTVGALNKEWNTKFEDWEDVTGILLAQVPDTAHPGGWVDHRRFMDAVFTTRTRRYREAVNAHDPTVTVGLSGTQRQSPWANYDWWQLCRGGNLWLSYGGVQTLLRRSFKPPDTVMAMWTGGYDRSDRGECTTRQGPWRMLFNRYDAYAYYWGGSDAFIMLNGDLTPCNRATWAGEEIRFMQRGLARLLLRSELDTFGVGIHYSPASHYSSHVTAKAQKGRPPFVGHRAASNLVSIGLPIQDIRRQFTYVAYQQIELGDLAERQFRLLLLPNSQAVSKREAEQIRKWVAAGGTVVADFAVAQRNEHGTWQVRGLLDDVFGFSATKESLVFKKAKLEITKPFGSLSPGPFGEFSAPFEDGLEIRSAVAHGTVTSGSRQAPALLVNTFGKGRAIYLNFSFVGYGGLKVSGWQNEFTETQRLKAAQGQRIRELMAGLMDMAGSRSELGLERADDRITFPQVYVYRSDANQYVGIWPEVRQPDPMDLEKLDAYTLRLPAKAHLYDCRNRKYLGEGQAFEIRPVMGLPSVYAALGYRVTGLTLPTSGRAKLGGRAVARVLISGTEGEMGEHVVQVDVLDPTGKRREEYSRNVVVSSGRAEFHFPLALNDPTGSYKLTATDAATGTTGGCEIVVER